MSQDDQHEPTPRTWRLASRSGITGRLVACLRSTAVVALAFPAIAMATPFSITYDLTRYGGSYSTPSDPPPEGIFWDLFLNQPITGTLEFDPSRSQPTTYGYENLLGITMRLGDLVFEAHVPDGQFASMRAGGLAGAGKLSAALLDPSQTSQIAQYPGQNVSAVVTGPTVLGLVPKEVWFGMDLSPDLKFSFPSIAEFETHVATFAVSFETPRGNIVDILGRSALPPIPEPATPLLWLAGLSLLGALAWSRRVAGRRASVLMALSLPAIVMAAPHEITFDLVPWGVTYSIASDPPPSNFFDISLNQPITGTLAFDTAQTQPTAYGYENLIGITMRFGDLVFESHMPDGQFASMRVDDNGGNSLLDAELVDPSLTTRIAQYPGQNVAAAVTGPIYLGLVPKIMSFAVDLGPDLKTSFPSIAELVRSRGLFQVGFETPRGNFVTFGGLVGVAPVPEPATLLMWFVGLPLLGALERWRRHAGHPAV